MTKRTRIAGNQRRVSRNTSPVPPTQLSPTSASDSRSQVTQRQGTRDPSQTKRKQVAAILRAKARTITGRRRTLLNAMARRIERCREEDPVHDFQETACKERLCPAYMTRRHATRATRRLRAQFREVPLARLFFLRVTHLDHHVPWTRLKEAKKDLNYLVQILTQSPVWRWSFIRWGGTPHLEWTPPSKKHPSGGFGVHLHLICQADTDPDVDGVAERWLRVIGRPSNDDESYLYLHTVRTFKGSTMYVPRVGMLLPGYEEDHAGNLKLQRMSVDEIFAFLDATKGTRRLLSKRFNLVRDQATKRRRRIGRRS